MLASWDGKELQARPMGAYVRPEEAAVFFLADRRHHRDDDIKIYSKVCLAFSDTSGQKHVSVAGNAEVLEDRSKISELWGLTAKARWSSPNDPNIRLLTKLRIKSRFDAFSVSTFRKSITLLPVVAAVGPATAQTRTDCRPGILDGQQMLGPGRVARERAAS
jgi:general stress protein 26